MPTQVRPTIAYQEPQERGAAEDSNGAEGTSTCSHVTAKATRKDDRAAETTRSDESEERADEVTENNTRKNGKEELGNENKNAKTNCTPRGARGSRDVNFENGAARLTGPAELASNWQRFLERKFSETEMEKMRADFEALPNSREPETQMSRKEFDEAVDSMKTGKAQGADGIPSEIWAGSKEVRNLLF